MNDRIKNSIRISDVPATITLLVAYAFLQSYFFNVGYFFESHSARFNPFLSLADIISTSASATSIATVILILMFSEVMKVYKLERQIVWAMIAIGVLAFANLIRLYMTGNIATAWGMVSICTAVSIALLKLLTPYLRSLPDAVATIGLWMIVFLSSSMPIGLDTYHRQDYRYELKTNDGYKIFSRKFRNLEAGYFVVDQNGNGLLLNKAAIIEVKYITNSKTP